MKNIGFNCPDKLKRRILRSLIVVSGLTFNKWNHPSQWAQRYLKCIKSNKTQSVNSRNHPNRPLYPIPQLIEDVNNWKHKIAAIVYPRKLGTPNILAGLQSTKILALQVTKHLPTQRVLRYYRFVEDLVRVHPSYFTELLDIIVRKERNFRKLIQKRRTHKRKQSKKATAKKSSISTKVCHYSFYSCQFKEAQLPRSCKKAVKYATQEARICP